MIRPGTRGSLTATPLAPDNPSPSPWTAQGLHLAGQQPPPGQEKVIRGKQDLGCQLHRVTQRVGAEGQI